MAAGTGEAGGCAPASGRATSTPACSSDLGLWSRSCRASAAVKQEKALLAGSEMALTRSTSKAARAGRPTRIAGSRFTTADLSVHLRSRLSLSAARSAEEKERTRDVTV